MKAFATLSSSPYPPILAAEGAVCKELGATLHWLDEIDGEAYASRETCERLAAILKELKPRAVFAHWPVDIHGDHAMAGVAVQKALFLAGLTPELYFIEQEYQGKTIFQEMPPPRRRSDLRFQGAKP